MGRSVHSKPYRNLLSLVIAARTSAGLTQTALADRIGRTQSFVSKYERGERRLDVVEFAEFILAMDLDPSALFASFVQEHVQRPCEHTAKRSVRASPSSKTNSQITKSAHKTRQR